MVNLDLIIRATIRSVVLSGISNILAQLITAYQTNSPYRIDPAPLTRFLIFSFLSSPPNMLWQSWLEHTFPSRPSPSPGSSPSSSSTRPPPPFSKRNLLLKFLLDQSLGATLNTVAFLAGMSLLRGETDPATVAAKVARETWPLMRAGQKLWPAVSLLSFAVVPWEARTLFGGVVGVGWGVYLSLVEGGRRGKRG